MFNNVKKVWLTPWDESGLATLSIGLELDSPIHVSDETFHQRGVRTARIGLLSDEALQQIYYAIGRYLEGER